MGKVALRASILLGCVIAIVAVAYATIADKASETPFKVELKQGDRLAIQLEQPYVFQIGDTLAYQFKLDQDKVNALGGIALQLNEGEPLPLANGNQPFLAETVALGDEGWMQSLVRVPDELVGKTLDAILINSSGQNDTALYNHIDIRRIGIPTVSVYDNEFTREVREVVPSGSASYERMKGSGITSESLEYALMASSFHSEEAIVSGYNVRDFGAKGDGKSDDTSSIQRALLQANYDGGGVVYVPEGEYAIRGRIVIPESVALRGDWDISAFAEQADRVHSGTTLLAYEGRGDEDGSPFITIGRSGGLKNVKIFYPEQSVGRLSPYPWTIWMRDQAWDHTTVEQVSLINSYNGIKIGSESNSLHYIREVNGTPLNKGIELDGSWDIGRIINVDFSPEYWSSYSKVSEQPIRDLLQAQATGFILGWSDWQYMYGLSTDYYATGVRVVNGKINGTSNAQFYDITVRNARIGFDLENASDKGIMFTKGKVEFSDVGFRLQNPVQGVVQIRDFRFDGKQKAVYSEEQSGAFVSIQDSFFDQKALIEMNGGSYSVHQSNTGQLESASDAQDNYGFSGIPKKTPDIRSYLLVATDKEYGAIGDGVHDDTRAIQKAIDASAKAGGGIVYLPAGKYRIDTSLTLPKGVELRGVHDVPHHTSGMGTLLYAYGGQGDEEGTPLIVLDGGAGVRGLTIWYPEQDLDHIVPYPWAIQSRGEANWLIHVSLGNAYLGADFGTYNNSGHFIDYVVGAPLKKGLFVGNSSSGTILNVHFNPHYAIRIDNALLPSNFAFRLDPLVNYQREHLDGFIFGDVSKSVVYGTFVFGARNGIRFVEQNGKAMSGVIIGHATDGSQHGVWVDRADRLTMVNTQLSSIGNAPDTSFITVGQDAGKLSFHNVLLFGPKPYEIGQPDKSVSISGGQVEISQMNLLYNGTNSGLYADSGKITIENSYFQDRIKDVYQGADAHITLTDNYFYDGLQGVFRNRSQLLLKGNREKIKPLPIPIERVFKKEVDSVELRRAEAKDWTDAAKLSLSSGKSASIAWDEQYLYLYADRVERTLTLSVDAFHDRQGWRTPESYQLVVANDGAIQGNRGSKHKGFTDQWKPKVVLVRQPDHDQASSRLLLAIPWGELGLDAPWDDQEIGFQLIIDGEVWSKASTEVGIDSPMTWGTLRLVSSQ